MSKFSYEIKIESATKEEAETKLQAAATLMQKLSAKEIAKLADVVKNDPAMTAIAKRTLGL
jgi:hypothetical protein